MNPYKILGVAHDASDEQITTAYKKLAKKFHPDLNPDNQESAAKMSEINVAYDLIKSGKTNYAYENAYGMSQSQSGQTSPGRQTDDPFSGTGNSRQSDSFAGFDPFEWIFGAYSNQNRRSNFDTVVNFINIGNYYEALTTLNNISDRSAKWYYYSAIANYGIGNHEDAINQARMAIEMEPNNQEYQSLLNQIERNNRGFRSHRSGFSPIGTILKLFLGFYVIQFLFSFLGTIF
ncbi:MAG: DnaJ domain-containing protein [Acetobacterium sp.]